MSIFKSTLKPFLRRQLNTRQKLLSANDRPSYFSKYVSARSPWARMVSFVDVIDEKTNQPSMETAKKYVLYAGESYTTQDEKGIRYLLRRGIDQERGAYFNNLIDRNGTPEYGGIRPMAGIEHISLRSLSAYGSLREATVTFYVWDKDQLSIMEKLYMRPGYYVLLEWGWSMYLDTNQGVKDLNLKQVDPISSQETVDISKEILKSTDYVGINVFDSNKTQEEYYAELEENRYKFSGNYDGMLGVVRNFSWEYLPNGGYRCTTILISIGEIIDSLKISSAGKQDPNDPNLGKTNTATYMEILLDNLNTGDPNNTEIVSYKTAAGNSNKSGLHTDIFKVDVGIPDKDSTVTRQASYIQFAYLVFILGIAGNLFDDNNDPLIDLEPPTEDANNYGNGLCLASRESLSVDPSVCLIQNQQSKFLLSNNTGFIIPAYTGDGTNRTAIKCFEYLKDGTTLGIIGNIYFNIAKVKSIYQDILKRDNKVCLGPFLRDLLLSANSVLGDINDFNLFSIDNKVVIIDTHYTEPAKDSQSSKKFLLNLSGNNTIVRSSIIQSKIFPSQATIVAISAQDPTNVGAVNSSTNNAFNKDIANRLRSQEVEFSDLGQNRNAATTKEEKQKEEELQKARLVNTILTLREYFTNVLLSKPIQLQINNPDQIASMASLLNSLILKLTNDANFRAIIPIVLEIDIDGTGGFTIGEIFKINQDILPDDYNDKNIGFIITGISNDIKRNDWITKIQTQICLLDQESYVTGSSAVINNTDIGNYLNIQRTISAKAIWYYNMLMAYAVEYISGINVETNDKEFKSNLILNGIFTRKAKNENYAKTFSPSTDGTFRAASFTDPYLYSFDSYEMNLYSYEDSLFPIVARFDTFYKNEQDARPEVLYSLLSADLAKSAAALLSIPKYQTNGIQLILSHIYYDDYAYPNVKKLMKTDDKAMVSLFLNESISYNIGYFYSPNDTNYRVVNVGAGNKLYLLPEPTSVKIISDKSYNYGINVKGKYPQDTVIKERALDFLSNQIVNSNAFKNLPENLQAFFKLNYDAAVKEVQTKGKGLFMFLSSKSYNQETGQLVALQNLEFGYQAEFGKRWERRKKITPEQEKAILEQIRKDREANSNYTAPGFVPRFEFKQPPAKKKTTDPNSLSFDNFTPPLGNNE